jgi:hypothetical protein
MDTTVVLLSVCVVLIAITLMTMVGFCCLLRVYLKRQAAANNYRPSYNLESVYTNGPRENLGFRPEKKNVAEGETPNERDRTKMDGNKNEMVKT